MCTALALAQSLFFSPGAWGALADELDELRAMPLPRLVALVERLIAERRIHIHVDATALAKLIDCQVVGQRSGDVRDFVELREPSLAELLGSVPPVAAAVGRKSKRGAVPVVKALQLPKRQPVRPSRKHPWIKDARDGVRKWREQHGQTA